MARHYIYQQREQAEELAESRVSFLGGVAVINEFEFDETLLVEGVEEPVRVKIFPHYCLEWAEFVWNNRDEEQDYKHDYGIVYGPIANDTIGYQMRQYHLYSQAISNARAGGAVLQGCR